MRPAIAEAVRRWKYEDLPAIARGEVPLVSPLSGPRDLTLGEVLDEVSRYSCLESRAIKGPRRDGGIVPARWLAMHLSLEYTRQSMDAVAAHYGRDRTTALHAIKRMEAQPEVFGPALTELRARLDALAME